MNDEGDRKRKCLREAVEQFFTLFRQLEQTPETTFSHMDIFYAALNNFIIKIFVGMFHVCVDCNKFQC